MPNITFRVSAAELQLYRNIKLNVRKVILQYIGNDGFEGLVECLGEHGVLGDFKKGEAEALIAKMRVFKEFAVKEHFELDKGMLQCCSKDDGERYKNPPKKRLVVPKRKG